MRTQDKYAVPGEKGTRRKPALIAGMAVTIAVAAGALGFVLTQSSSAQTGSTPAASPSPSAAKSASTPGAQPAAQSVFPVEAMSRASYGKILVSDSGATLYRYTPDKPNTPTCTGSCAMAWPPDLLPAGSMAVPSGGLTGLGSVTLPDGRRQLTYNKMPLYTFADDHGTSVNGQGIGGVWFVVHPTTTHTATPSVASTAPAAKSSPGAGYGY